MENLQSLSQRLPDRYCIIFHKYQFTIVVLEIIGIGFGILLIGMAALVAVRSFVNKRQQGPSAN